MYTEPKTEALTSSFHSSSPGPKKQASKGVHSSRVPVYQGCPLCCVLYTYFIHVTAFKVLASFFAEQGDRLRKAENLLKAHAMPAGPGFSARTPRSQACAPLIPSHTVPRNQHLPESLSRERGRPLPNKAWAADPSPICSIAWTLGELFQLAGKSISADTSALNSTSVICKQYKDIKTKLSAEFPA